MSTSVETLTGWPAYVLPPETRSRRYDKASLLTWSTVVYRLLGEGYELLYVGITGNPVERWRRHAQRKPWWPDVRCIFYEKAPSEFDALARERELIRLHHPLYNIRSAWRSA